MRPWILLGLSLCLSDAPAAALQPGEWLITSRVKLVDAKARPRASSIRYCIKPGEAESPADAITRANDDLKKQQCSFIEKTETDSSVRYRMNCSGTLPLQAEGVFTFTETTYQGDVDMKVEGGLEGPISVKSQVSAKRVGDCRPDPAE